MLAIKRTAYALDNVVRIMTSIIKKLGANPLVFALLEEIQGILDKLNTLYKSIKALPASLPKLVITRASSDRRSSQGGAGRRSWGGSRAGPRKESSSPLADLDT